MNASATWQENNAKQLAAAVADVRERLERYLQRQSPPPSPSVPSPAPSAPRVPAGRTVSRSLLQRLLLAESTPSPASTSPSAPVTEEPAADARREPTERAVPPSALEMVSQ